MFQDTEQVIFCICSGREIKRKTRKGPSPKKIIYRLKQSTARRNQNQSGTGKIEMPLAYHNCWNSQKFGRSCIMIDFLNFKERRSYCAST